MSTPQAVSSRYQLKWLHQEIDLYDRKLAHLDKYSPHATSAERSRMVSKRGSLEKTARQMVADGAEFSPSDLPRSFRDEEESLQA